MPGQVRQSRLSGLFEDKVMHAKYEEAWMEREKARTAVPEPWPAALLFARCRRHGENSGKYVCMYVCMYVFIKLHITTQSGPVILVILCHSH